MMKDSCFCLRKGFGGLGGKQAQRGRRVRFAAETTLRRLRFASAPGLQKRRRGAGDWKMSLMKVKMISPGKPSDKMSHKINRNCA